MFRHKKEKNKRNKSGRTISNNDSLISAGIKDGDILHLTSSHKTGDLEMTSVTINKNPMEISDGMKAVDILKTAGFSSGHHLALEMSDGTLMYLDNNEPVKASPGDNFIPVPPSHKQMTSVTMNGNPIEISDGMTALEILKSAGFSSGHHLALEMPDGTLMHLDDNEPVKASPGDNFIPVPVAIKGR